MAFAKEDPIEDLIEFQEAVENLPVNEFLYSKLDWKTHKVVCTKV